MSNECEEWKKRALEAEEDARTWKARAEMNRRGWESDRSRAEQAERERDEALSIGLQRLERAGAAEQECDIHKEARDIAEADNAAKDKAFREYVEAWGVCHEDIPGTETPCPEDDTCECQLIVALNEAFGPSNPGAALLAEVEALRKVLAASRVCVPAILGSRAPEAMLADAIAAVDALKGKA